MISQIAIHRAIEPITPDTIQIALIEDNQVVEINMEPLLSTPIMRVGDIYRAKVVRILLSMQMAFVEIGEKRTALLHFAQIPKPHGKGHTDVAQFLRVGQYLPVQITKLPRGEKGAVVSGFVQIVGALLIYQPYIHGVRLSKKITETQEQERLLAMHLEHVMMRSLAVNQPIENFQSEYLRLQSEWEQIEKKMATLKPCQLIRAEFSLVQSYIRDHISNLQAVQIDDADLYAALEIFMRTWLLPWIDRLQYKLGKHTWWAQYKIDSIMHQASLHHLKLPSGGFIVIEQTEAMITVDVNTGMSVKCPKGVDIIVQTNSEAACLLAHHIRLCNLAGIIVVDFIGMKSEASQQVVLQILEKALSRDSAYTTLYGFSPLGLVEMSRERRGQSWVKK